MLEDARPFSESKRINKNAELIHKAMLEHCVRQLAHAILHQTLARLLFELPDLLSNVSLYECSVPLKRLLPGSGRNVLGHTVYPVRVFSFPGRPDLGKHFVGLPTYQERVWHEEKLVEVCLNIRAVGWKNLFPKIHILPTHHSIERHLSFYNYFSHVQPPETLSRHGRGAVLYKNDNCRVTRAISAGVCPIRYLSDRVR